MVGPDQLLREASDPALVVLAREGSDTAFAELVRRHQGTVRGLLRRLSGDMALADDLAQEAFIQAWQNLAGLRVAGAFPAWMRRIAVNVWLRHARRNQIRFESIDDLNIDEGYAASVGNTLDAAGRIDLMIALDRLRPPQRLCIVLSYVEGMSHGEIAGATGLPLGTVKSHLARATTKLREWLEGGTVKVT